MFGAGESTYPRPLLSSHLPAAVATSGGQGLRGREETTVQLFLPATPTGTGAATGAGYK